MSSASSVFYVPGADECARSNPYVPCTDECIVPLVTPVYLVLMNANGRCGPVYLVQMNVQCLQ